MLGHPTHLLFLHVVTSFSTSSRYNAAGRALKDAGIMLFGPPRHQNHEPKKPLLFIYYSG
jgi:hypothetical protein